MANVIVFIELRQGRPTAPSRHAVGEARRVAGALGATVYALAGTAAAADDALDALAAELGEGGADRALICVDEALGGPILDPTFGPLLHAVCEKLRPRLFLLPAGRAGEELGAALAVRTGAAYHPRASLELSDAANGEAPALRLRRFRGAGGVRDVDLAELDKSAVATLSAGDAAAPLGRSIEVEVVALPTERVRRLETTDLGEDETARVELAATLVVAGSGVPPSTLDALRAALPFAAVAEGDAAAGGLSASSPARLVYLGAGDNGATSSMRPAPDAVTLWAGAKVAPKSGPPVAAIWPGSLEAAAQALAQTLGREVGAAVPAPASTQGAEAEEQP